MEEKCIDKQYESIFNTLLTQGLASHTRLPDIQLSKGNSQAKPYWRVLILGLGDEFNFEIVIKFFSHRILEMLNKQCEAEEESRGVCCDYMREICNVLCGQVQRYLFDYSIETGLSLPVLTRGFDEYLLLDKIGYFGALQSFEWTVSLPEKDGPLFDLMLKIHAESKSKLTDYQFSMPGDDKGDQIELL